jgi:hypothetical protein
LKDKISGNTAPSKSIETLCDRLTRRAGTLSIAASMLILLTGCDIYRVAENCKDHIPPGDKGKFITDPNGLAKDIETGTTWYRCAAGKRFSNYRCKGEGLHLSWDEAKEYATEFSEKSGIKWRLPTNDEMKSIIESSCNGPAVNDNVFPSTESNNHWTSSDSWHQKTFKCSINTYNGSLTCRQARVLEQPFLLVQD